MNRNSLVRIGLLVASFSAALVLPTRAYIQPATAPVPAKPTIIRVVSHAVSAPLRQLAGMKPTGRSGGTSSARLPINSFAPLASITSAAKPTILLAAGQDPDLQKNYPSSVLPLYGVSEDGIHAENPGVWPPDTNVAVGAHQVVEVVNVRLAIYDKAGHLQAGPVPISTLFSGLAGSLCSDTNNGGVPIVIYDQIAQRWLISRLSRPAVQGVVMNHLCVAVSQGPDADLSSYNLYDFDYGTNKPDSPKFGAWPDAYYFSANTFANSTTFVGSQVCAFDRSAMLAGSPNPAVVCFQGNTSLHSILPSSLDGATAPPAGSPNYFLQYDSNQLGLYKFQVNFAVPGQSSFTGPTNIPVGAFTEPVVDSIPQPGTADKLAVGGNKLQYRLSYRNFGSYESLLVNHTVKVSPTSNQTGIRWYEIRRPNGVPQVTQQSTFSPDTTNYRWVGSIAQDKQGNMMLGYNVSSSSLYPGIRYTGRDAQVDPLNQMEREGTILSGGGSQINPSPGTSNRWANWASVAVDPVDDCTFWFAAEYIQTTGTAPNWSTRIASVRFPRCH